MLAASESLCRGEARGDLPPPTQCFWVSGLCSGHSQENSQRPGFANSFSASYNWNTDLSYLAWPSQNKCLEIQGWNEEESFWEGRYGTGRKLGSLVPGIFPAAATSLCLTLTLCPQDLDTNLQGMGKGDIFGFLLNQVYGFFKLIDLLLFKYSCLHFPTTKFMF